MPEIDDPLEGALIHRVQSWIAWIDAYYAQLKTEWDIDVDDLCQEFSE